MRRSTGPTFSSNEKDLELGDSIPSFSRTKPVPIVGWPAKIISLKGVNIRTRATQVGFVGGKTNVVSARFISRAIFCIVWPSSCDAPVNTDKKWTFYKRDEAKIKQIKKAILAEI
jgi:hypothetical protein